MSIDGGVKIGSVMSIYLYWQNIGVSVLVQYCVSVSVKVLVSVQP